MSIVGLIGFGAIARDVIDILCGRTPPPEALVLVVRAGREAETLSAARDQIAGRCRLSVVSTVEDLQAARPGVVVECAGHSAVTGFAPAILGAGVDMIVASVGALADPATEAALTRAATAGRAQLVVPAGAIGGIDMLAAARLSGLNAVTYTGRKPPHAWSGTPAEEKLNLDDLSEPAVFFDGSARQAATDYPKNANVAATLALAGMGMDATRVRLIADPAAGANTHEFSVRSTAVDFEVSLTSKPSPRNAKTSASTAFSIARAVLNRSGAIVI